MKTLKFFSIVLGLIILLIGLNISCDKVKNPYDPIPPINPPDNTKIYQVTVDFTGEPVVATTYKYAMTLNRVWTEQKLQDRHLGGWYYPKGQFVIIEAKVKNIEPNLNSWSSFTYKRFTMADRYDNVHSPWHRTSACFYNPVGIHLLKYHEETPLSILVFDVPENATGLVLIFNDRYSTPTIIKFNLLTL